MELHVDGYTIRPFRADDLADFVTYRRVRGIAAYQSWGTAYSQDDARALLDAQEGWDFPPVGEWMHYAVTDAVGALLGDVAVHAVDGQPDSYEIGANDVRNEPVRRLLARVGLRLEGAAVEADWFKGEWTTVETWALLAREWAAAQETGASRSSSS